MGVVHISFIYFSPSDPVVAFNLEPVGTKLAIIHGEPSTRISVSFYGINEKGNPPTNLSEFGPVLHCMHAYMYTSSDVFISFIFVFVFVFFFFFSFQKLLRNKLLTPFSGLPRDSLLFWPN